MRFADSTCKQFASRVGRYGLFAFIVSLVVLGGLLARGSANPQDKFTMTDATTTENDGKRLKAKPGYKLKIASQSTGEVVAYKVGAATMTSTDKKTCFCYEQVRCSENGNKQPCCPGHTGRIACSASLDEATEEVECSGTCDVCRFR